MLTVSTRTLNILAAFVWYVGGFMLLIKGCSMLVEADTLKPVQWWIWPAVFAGPFIGILKAKFLLNKSCQKNLDRITALARPRIWQFYSPWFFVALSAMITTGIILSRLAHHNYHFLIIVAIIDFSIAIALLGSSYIFWKQKAFAK